MGRRERPLDPEQGPVQRFAFELRRLRESAGTPSYRELARRAHYSVTALSEAAGGEIFPSLAVTVAFVGACGGDQDVWRRRWENTSARLTADDDISEKAPYRGLAAFQPEDADRFVGRRGLIEELCGRLATAPFLAVFGASGSGKSSLLRAGLLPAIWRGEVPGSADWPTGLLTPGSRPVEQLAIQLANLAGISAMPVTADLRADPHAVRVLIEQILTRRARKARLVIVVDQFEEIFTLCRDEEERTCFLDCLLACGDRARVVVGVRADFYSRCAQYPALVAALRDHLLVGPMAAADLRAVVREPAVDAGLTVEAALVEAVLADTEGEPGALPLLSHALLETWKRRSGDRMTLTGYRRAGGVHGAIARTADKVFAELDVEEQQVVRSVFVRLTALGEGTEDTRRRVARGELLGMADAESVTKVLARLAQERLVILGQDTVEVAHEALIRSWPRLRSWLTEDREALSVHRRLTETVAEWERHARDEGLLYRGARLATWQDRPTERLNDTEREFLAASRRAADRERTARRRRARLAIGGLGTATIVVTVLAVLALLLARQAEVERELAYSRQLVADARAQAQLDPELGLLLAREAFGVRPGADTEAALRQAALDSHVLATLSGHQGKICGVGFAPDGRHLVTGGADGALRVWAWRGGRPDRGVPIVLRGHRGEVWTPVFSPDGTRIAAAGFDGVVSVWNWRDRTPVFLRGHRDQVWAVAFSPDGRWVASAGQDGTVRVWPADGRGEPVVLRGHEGRVLGVAWSPDGRRLVSGGGDGTVRVWHLNSAAAPLVLRGHQDSVESVSFSPDGRHVATASTDGTARIWDSTGTDDTVVLGGHDGTAEGVAYSPDGRWIATTGNDGIVRVWNAVDHALPTVLRGHRGTVWAAAFSADSTSVVSVSDDGTARVWQLDETGDLTVLRGHTGPVWRAEFSPDGRRVASAGADGTVRVWSTSGAADPVLLRTGGGAVEQVVWSPNGRLVAGVGADGTVSIWPANGVGEPVVLPVADGNVWQVAFSPDSRRIAVGNGRSFVSVLNVTGAGEPEVLPANQGRLLAVAWSPDGRRVAAAGERGAVVVWDVVRHTAPEVWRGHRGAVWAVTFSRDSATVASGGNDGSVRVWRSGSEPVVLNGHQGMVWSAAFAGDDRYLTTSGNDGTVRLWRIDRPGESLVVDGFRASIESVRRSADGRFVTAHGDGTVRLWRCPTCGPVAEVLTYADDHVTRRLTPEERAAYLDQ